MILPWPPTVNTYYTVVRGRKILSKKGRLYGPLVALAVADEPKGREGPLLVKIVAHPPDRRKRDLDNLLKPVLDGLQKAGMYADDSQIDRLEITRGDIIKGGRLDLWIAEYAREKM